MLKYRSKNVLKLISLRKGRAHVQYETSEKDIPGLVDFNPVQGKFTTMRDAFFATTNTKKLLSDQLAKAENASIISKVSHEPEDETYKQIMLWGEPFVDGFGYYVYVKQMFVWHRAADIDTRFNSNFPHKWAEPDLAFLFR